VLVGLLLGKSPANTRRSYRSSFPRGAQVSFSYQRSVGTSSNTTSGIATGTLTTYDEDGCSAFGSVDDSSVAR
jgi:hypothetical protein